MLWQKVRSYLDYWKQQHLDKKIKLFISVKKKEDDEVFQKGIELALTIIFELFQTSIYELGQNRQIKMPSMLLKAPISFFYRIMASTLVARADNIVFAMFS